MVKRISIAVIVLVSGVLAVSSRMGAQTLSLSVLRPANELELQTADRRVTQMARAGQLRLRSSDRDPAFPRRVTERFQQFHQDVPVFGADVVRDAEQGVARSILGTMVPDFELSVTPGLSADEAETALRRLAGDNPKILREPELVILPLASGPRLAYAAVLSTPADIFRLFADARSGVELLRISEIQTQAAVGEGSGVLGDRKKLSVLQQAGVFVADDQHRPPVLTTYDMRFNLSRATSVVLGADVLVSSDVASDVDNIWDDPVAVDGHVNIGWTYDYYYKRFGRRGLDDRDRRITTLINGVSQQGALTLPSGLFGLFAVNAFWCGTCGSGAVGLMYFGNGIPPNVFLTANGRTYGYFAGALDIAAHELTHGVTDSSSRLIYVNESGALNEAFSDIMGTSVEFFYQPAGGGLGQADYLLGEDISRALRPGSLNGDRSLADPAAYGDPDHYSRRYIGTADNGGVHTNSGIANHAFYLAIEGGTNRTSGISVQGVGPASRDQIERAFYRAFVFLLPASATFSLARAATVQAARDLFGVTSPAQAAIGQAWTAVGVN